MAGMIEIQCPHCGKITAIQPIDLDEWDYWHHKKIKLGERPQFYCFNCVLLLFAQKAVILCWAVEFWDFPANLA